MAHHGDDSEILNLLGEQFAERMVNTSGELEQLLNTLRPGPTGKFPEGKLNEDDEGEIKIAIGRKNSKVVIDFGKSVAWIGFTPDQAIEIADTLKKHAWSIQAGQQGQ